jgi:hypothetical protein
MPLDVYVQYPGGQTELQTVWLDPKNGKASVSFRISGIPELVSFDPYLRAYRVMDPSEKPASISSVFQKLKIVRDAKHPEYAPEMTGAVASADDQSLEGKLFIGHPATLPQVKELLNRVGWSLKGNNIAWDDTSIDIRNGQAIAIVDLGQGKYSGFLIGKTLMPAHYGKASAVLVDQLGRMLKSTTNPKTNGALTKKF